MFQILQPNVCLWHEFVKLYAMHSGRNNNSVTTDSVSVAIICKGLTILLATIQLSICIWKDNLDSLDEAEDDKELLMKENYEIVIEFGKKYSIPLIISEPKKGKIS